MWTKPVWLYLWYVAMHPPHQTWSCSGQYISTIFPGWFSHSRKFSSSFTSWFKCRLADLPNILWLLIVGNFLCCPTHIGHRFELHSKQKFEASFCMPSRLQAVHMNSNSNALSKPLARSAKSFFLSFLPFIFALDEKQLQHFGLSKNWHY